MKNNEIHELSNLLLDLFDDYKSDKKEIKEKKKRKKVVHRDVIKIKRKRKEKRDYVDKDELYTLMCNFKHLSHEIECYDIIKFRKQRKNFILKKRKNDIIDIKTLKKLKKEIQDELILNYYNIANKFIKHPNFRGYTKDMSISCEDLINDAIERALGIGKKGNTNYGIPYFARFDIFEFDNVFSFFTQQIGNYFLQYLNKQYSHENKKWEMLNRIINRHNIENIKNGIKGYYVGIGDVCERDD